MPNCSVVLLGSQMSGKTSLMQLLANRDSPFNEKYIPTIGTDFCTMKQKEDTIILWDMSGNPMHQSLAMFSYNGANLGVYCVDLANDEQLADVNGIIHKISEFLRYAPRTPIMLVGTCHDKLQIDVERKIAIEKFDVLFEKLQRLFSAGKHITSARNGHGVDELRNQMFLLAEERAESKENPSPENALDSMDNVINDVPDTALLHEKLVTLKNTMKGLPAAKYNLIAKAAETLVNNLKSSLGINKMTDITEFELSCYRHLKGEHPILKAVAKAVAAVAVTAAVTLIAAMVGFGIGFAMGAWTGPGAFISGVAAGSAAACAVVASSGAAGLVAGAAATYGLFKASPLEKAVHAVAESIKTQSDSSFDF
jgi:GTPase SAR1 family protein